jgi:hypothetical protein
LDQGGLDCLINDKGEADQYSKGKPGAGKSTLMKFLLADPRTRKHLETWSAGSSLRCGSFFFWNSGKNIQMSQEGLLRSILYGVLRESKQLSPTLFPAKWEAYSLFSQTVEDRWTFHELEHALKALVEIGLTRNMKFCFFIDGLDEFDGHHTELVHLIREVVSSHDHVKACISSRPWNVFEDAFNDCPSLAVQELTDLDIAYYVTAKLKQNIGFREMQIRDPKLEERLVKNISKKASGVFLWVDLIMRTLLDGLTAGDHIFELERRVDELPRGLESLFEAILKNVERQNPSHLALASKLFQLVRTALEPLTILCLYYADEVDQDPQFSGSVRMGPLSSEQSWSQAATMKRRLNARTKGLLEINRYSNVSLLS